MDEAAGDPVRRDPSSAARPNARAVAVADAVMEWQRHNGAVFDIAAGEVGNAWRGPPGRRGRRELRAEHDRALTRGKGPAHDGRP